MCRSFSFCPFHYFNNMFAIWLCTFVVCFTSLLVGTRVSYDFSYLFGLWYSNTRRRQSAVTFWQLNRGRLLLQHPFSSSSSSFLSFLEWNFLAMKVFADFTWSALWTTNSEGYPISYSSSSSSSSSCFLLVSVLLQWNFWQVFHNHQTSIVGVREFAAINHSLHLHPSLVFCFLGLYCGWGNWHQQLAGWLAGWLAGLWWVTILLWYTYSPLADCCTYVVWISNLLFY